MRFDTVDHSWRPAHEPKIRLRAPVGMLLSLAIVAFGALSLTVRNAPPAQSGRAVATVMVH